MEFIPSLKNQSNAFSQMTENKMDQLQKQAGSGEYKDDKELRELAKQFESIFMNQLMKSMRETLPKEGLLSSFSGGMYEQMFDQEVAGEMSKGKGMGLADVLYTQFRQLNGDKPEGEANAEKADPPAIPFKTPDEGGSR